MLQQQRQLHAHAHKPLLELAHECGHKCLQVEDGLLALLQGCERGEQRSKRRWQRSSSGRRLPRLAAPVPDNLATPPSPPCHPLRACSRASNTAAASAVLCRSSSSSRRIRQRDSLRRMICRTRSVGGAGGHAGESESALVAEGSRNTAAPAAAAALHQRAALAGPRGSQLQALPLPPATRASGGMQLVSSSYSLPRTCRVVCECVCVCGWVGGVGVGVGGAGMAQRAAHASAPRPAPPCHPSHPHARLVQHLG